MKETQINADISKKEFEPNDRIVYSPHGKVPRHGVIANNSMAGLGAFQVWFDGHSVAEVCLVEYMTLEPTTLSPSAREKIKEIGL